MDRRVRMCYSRHEERSGRQVSHEIRYGWWLEWRRSFILSQEAENRGYVPLFRQQKQSLRFLSLAPACSVALTLALISVSSAPAVQIPVTALKSQLTWRATSRWSQRQYPIDYQLFCSMVPMDEQHTGIAVWKAMLGSSSCLCPCTPPNHQIIQLR
jgi:hypothetical protein